MFAGLFDPCKRHQGENGQEAGKAEEKTRLLTGISFIDCYLYFVQWCFLLIRLCFVIFVCLRRATTRRAAVKEWRLQSSPRRAVSSAARSCEETGLSASTIALTTSPTGQNWTEHTHISFVFLFQLSLFHSALLFKKKKFTFPCFAHPKVPSQSVIKAS